MRILLLILNYFCFIQESDDDDDDVIIESEEEQLDSGYDVLWPWLLSLIFHVMSLFNVNTTNNGIMKWTTLQNFIDVCNNQ